ncbi:MAG: AAA family ATPase [Cyanobacteria bacterium J06633_8]
MTATAPQFPEISGYTITEQLYMGSRTAVYRAVQNNQQLPVVIKVLQREYPTFGELVQFRNQYPITKNLPIAGIIQPLSLETLGNSYALVMPDWGGISLDKYIQQQSLELGDILTIAIQLAEILHNLHQHRVIHKDIKPANILIHPESKQVKLIDFSIASVLPKETQEIQNPNTLEGTLAYIAPEQTGRMNRGIDYRSDFYAFGVTLYQLFSGRLPFITDDPLELVHCHIAKIATLANHVNTDVPKMVGAIVAKLMAKNAEDRYQSGLGLKHDLEECLSQWKNSGSITEFDLGQKDLCDRFVIPEKLYGRETEVQMLLDAFERISQGTAELMLVAGYSGVGKTAVVNEVHKPITRQRGYFIKGKFDQFNRTIPFSAFVQAFRSLMGQLLSESDTEIKEWKTKILEAVGKSGQVLIEVIPELERIIGSQPPVPELSGSAAQNRFNLLLQKFIAVFTSIDHPLVMFLDDLQWADSASLNLLNLLMAESETGYLLVLGAYRDNEVFSAHPLMLTLGDIKEHQAQIHTLTLKPLDRVHINQLVADTLLCTMELSAPLGELIHQKTQGNPFFATQFLQGLYEENCITFEAKGGYWQCDLTQVRQLALTNDVVAFIVRQLQKLPTKTQDILKIAACIGNQFDLSTLSIICQQPQEVIATELWSSLQAGLVIPQSDTYKFFHGIEEEAILDEIAISYRFLHDRVQQAAYELIPDDEKHIKHYQIGKLLQQATSSEEKSEKIFDLVNHLNYGIDLVTDTAERQELAELNLQAGIKAKTTLAYTEAASYLQTGIEFLTEQRWHNYYDLTLNLYSELVNVDYLRGEFAVVHETSQLVLENIQDSADAVLIHIAQISCYQTEGDVLAGLELGTKVLDSLGIDILKKDSDTILSQTSQEFQAKSIDDFINLPQTQDKNILRIHKLLTVMIGCAFKAKPELLPVIICEQITLLLRYGNIPASASIYGCYGMLLSNLQDFESADFAGKVALAVMEAFPHKEFEVRASLFIYSFINPWNKALKESILPLKKYIPTGIESGDIEYTSYVINHYAQFIFFAGFELANIAEEITFYSHILKTHKQEFVLFINEMMHQTAINFLNISDAPWQLDGEVFQESQHIQEWQTNGFAILNGILYINKLMLSVFFDNPVLGISYAKIVNNCGAGLTGEFQLSLLYYYEALSYLAVWDSSSEKEKSNIIDKVTSDLEKLELFSRHAPMNFQHKYDLVEAEKCRVLGHKLEAIELYDKSITRAKENEYIQEEALANELAAKFYLDWGKEKIAATYMQEAYYCYSRWGAKAKTDDLEQRYPNLLRPILQSAQESDGIWNNLMTISKLSTSVDYNNYETSNSTKINQVFDFAAILKASQALSRTIELDELLHQLTQIILQNSGGNRCALILPDESGEWQVRAIATPDDTQLCVQPLANNPNLPVKFIQYVKNTQETLVINELKTDLPIIDDYLRQRQPKSLLCLPLLNQGQLIGILYLKNRFTIGAFTNERVEVINFLCSQAAISLENARLYKKAQEYAQQLEQSQLQVVQSEKMASLGNLVAGVAHEINNPIGFLNGSISNGKDYVKDLLEYLETYHQQQPPTSEVEELAEDIDLDYLLEDLPKLLDAMKGATNRIKNISTSLRTFSRADTDYKVSANLHEGLDSTLLILKYRLKASDYRPAIQVTKDYGNLPIIECFPGQLNQVFMNILANAIDMFDEMAQTQSFKELEANPQQITIRTQIESNQVYIRIRDNGKGMSKDVQAKIFDNLFTTKEVGKGTGLGLAIARQIVMEKHGGSLNVLSEPGQGTEFVIQMSV